MCIDHRATLSLIVVVIIVFCFFLGGGGQRFATWHVGSLFSAQVSNPLPHALGEWGLNHWTTRQVPGQNTLDQETLS